MKAHFDDLRDTYHQAIYSGLINPDRGVLVHADGSVEGTAPDGTHVHISPEALAKATTPAANPRVVAVYYQPPSEGTEECVSVEVVGGPKRFARFWPKSKPPRIEWGWSLHESAQKVFANEALDD